MFNNEKLFLWVFFRNHQKVKLQSFLKYFDWVETQTSTTQNNVDEKIDGNNENKENKDSTEANRDINNSIKVSRKVLSGKQWLTIEDWLECSVPLCSLEIKHESRIERSHDSIVQTVFASARLGGDFLSDGWSQVFCRFR